MNVFWLYDAICSTPKRAEGRKALAGVQLSQAKPRRCSYDAEREMFPSRLRGTGPQIKRGSHRDARDPKLEARPEVGGKESTWETKIHSPQERG